MNQTSRSSVLVVILIVMMVGALSGLVSVNSAARRSQKNTEILKCLGRAQQQFDRNIVDMIHAGRDPKVYGPLLERMHAEAQVNYAQLDHGRCPIPKEKE